MLLGGYMRRILHVISLCLALAPLAHASLPYINIASDVQRPDEEFVITRVYSGNTPMIRWLATDNDSPADLSGWSFALWYARNNSATAGYAVAQASISSNAVLFSSITNFFAVPNDYYVSVLGTHTSGYVRTWGVGRMNQKWDFASNGPTGIPPSQTSLNWNQFLSYSGTWPFFAGSNITINTSSTGITINATATGGGISTMPSVFTGSVKSASSAGLALLNSSGATTVLFGAGGGLSAMFMDGASFTGVISGDGSGLTNLSLGAYSTSALLTLAKSGTNIIGGLSTSVVQFADLGGYMAATGGGGNVTFGPLSFTSNAWPQARILASTENETSIGMYFGPYRTSAFQQSQQARIIGYMTNSGTTPGQITISSAANTGKVSIAAIEYVQVENVRFDASTVTNVGTLHVSNMTAEGASTTMVPLWAGKTNNATVGSSGWVVNDIAQGRVDIRGGYPTPFMVMAYTNGQYSDVQRVATMLWSYMGGNSGLHPAGSGALIGFGTHSATNITQGAAIGNMTRGTNDYAQDMVFYVSDNTGTLRQRATLAHEGDLQVSNGVQAARFYIGTDTNIFFWRSGTNLYLRQYGVDGLFGQ